MDNPRVSVVMAVYNGERWLRQALDSILSQSGVTFEVIAVEDASTDSSPAILREYSNADKRIVLLENRENLGLTRCLNQGLKKARGEYLARMDADDICLPGRLADQAAYLDNRPEVGVLGGWTRVIDEQGRPLFDRFSPEDDQPLRAEMLIKNNAFAHSSVMLRTELLRQAGGYDETFRYAQDYELWTRLGRTTRLACLPSILIEWRTGSGNISSRHREEQLECQFRTSLRTLKEHLGESLDQEAYRRFWFALHGQTGLLEKNDLQRLEPLWCFLDKYSGGIPRTLDSLSGFAISLIREGRRQEGFNLLSILSAHCNLSVNKLKASRSLLASFFRISRK